MKKMYNKIKKGGHIMKKILFILLLAGLFALAACGGSGNNSDDEAIPYDAANPINLISSGRLPQNGFIAQSFGAGNDTTFYEIPEIIYTTTGAENGLIDTFMFFEGSVISRGALDGNLEYVIANTSANETVIVTFNPDLFDLAVEIANAHPELLLLSGNRNLCFFVKYMGLSVVYDMPAFVLIGLYYENSESFFASLSLYESKAREIEFTVGSNWEVFRVGRDIGAGTYIVTVSLPANLGVMGSGGLRYNLIIVNSPELAQEGVYLEYVVELLEGDTINVMSDGLFSIITFTPIQP